MRIPALLVAAILSVTPAMATTIAFDGYTLACDSQTTYGSSKFQSEGKVHYSALRHEWMGYAGNLNVKSKVLMWFEESKEQFAPIKGEFQVLCIEKSGEMRLYTCNMKKFVRIKRQPFCIGSGTPYAMAAMVIGLTAPEAVLVSSKLDIYTNDTVFAITLFEEKKPTEAVK